MLECSLLVHSDAKYKTHINASQTKPFFRTERVVLLTGPMAVLPPRSLSRVLGPSSLPCVPKRQQDQCERFDETDKHAALAVMDDFEKVRVVRHAVSESTAHTKARLL